ncbi:carboxymuconolactone decarboxylase family protein [Taibaiella chishuiensis]|uniref:AhpD family alkylhydroperoxidase n=1 Tax=Taibaiella chishuiensis TaxID=1434707 RepID=A0A2P8D7Q4_9BACT|nr:carboxymuconolactone decarboxylase family protein [Taibaiella chishuiensis]PSK93265.1 AhpD family alkylhydroperoxidase [Taibaiella chishuiensis]
MEQRIALPDLAQGFASGLFQSGAYIKKSGLDPKLLELVYYRVSQINGCAYCLDMHHQEAVQLGETELRLHTLAAWTECPYFSEAERAALAWAEAVTRAEAPDAVYEQLKGFYTQQQIADLTLAIANINSWNRINIAFRATPGHYRPGMFG